MDNKKKLLEGIQPGDKIRVWKDSIDCILLGSTETDVGENFIEVSVTNVGKFWFSLDEIKKIKKISGD